MAKNMLINKLLFVFFLLNIILTVAEILVLVNWFPYVPRNSTASLLVLIGLCVSLAIFTALLFLEKIMG